MVFHLVGWLVCRVLVNVANFGGINSLRPWTLLLHYVQQTLHGISVHSKMSLVHDRQDFLIKECTKRL